MRFTRTPIAALLVLLFAPSHPAFPNPVGEKLIAGSATFQRSTNALTIQQTTDRAIINWQGFSIGAAELTKFVQPSAASAVLNRVISGNPSSLLGRLEANGKVFLINPNGILVGGGAVINTHAFIGSTLDVSNAKFLAGGDLNFVGDSKAGILNLGAIKAQGGDVFLIGHSVTNAGSLEAAQGTVGLAAGNDVLLRHAGDQRLYVQASVPGSSVTPSGASNSGLIAAVQAELHAGGGNVYALAVNNSGSIQATGIIEKNGRVLLTSTGGNIENSGSIVARNANGDGGNITLADVQQASGLSTVTSTGVIDASGVGSAAQGGTVTISGYRTNLDGQALVDVSGDAGGGSALIGGDYQGRPGTVDNAQFATVGKDVRIHADAVTHGDGGKVIVWADQNTVFNGSISARGGATGGDGGLIETSGKVGLSVGQGARADAGAAAGKAGTWLLDPTSFTVTNGPGDTAGPTFTPTADNNTINGADITAALETGTDVVINTTSNFAGAGNVTFTSTSFNALIAPPTSKATLRVIADNDITVSAALGGASANNQFVVDFKAGGNITVSKGTGFIGARNVSMTATTGSIFLNGAVHAVGEITGGKLTGNDGNLTLNGMQGVSTANLSGSANTLIAKGLLTVNSSSGGADLLGKTEARELTGTVNSNFIQSRGSTTVSTNSTFINTLKNITSEGGRIDIDNFGSLAIDGALKAEGAKQNVSIRTIGDMNFLPGASIATSDTGTTSLTTLLNPFAGTPPAGNISSTQVGSLLAPVIKGGGALVLRPLGSAGVSAANPLFTAVSQLEAEPSFGGVFISNTGSALSIGTNAAGRDPDAAALGVRVNVTTTSPISIVNEGSILIQSPTGERVVGPGSVTIRALGASSDILVANVNANGVSSRNGTVTLDAGRDVNIGMFVPVSAAGNIIGATGVDLTAGNQVRIIRGSSVMAQGTGNVNVIASTIDIEDLGPVATRIQTQGGAINLTSRAGGQLFLLGSSGGGLFTSNLTPGKSGNINLLADRMVLEGRMDAGDATVDIAPQTSNRPVSIGPNTLFSPDQGMLVIPDAALDRVTAGLLSIGRNSGDGSAALTVNEAISRPLFATYSTLRLLNRGDVKIVSPIDIGVGDLLLQGGIRNVEGSGNITANTLNVSAPVGAINLGGNITATQRLDATSAGNMTFSGNVNSNNLNLTSSTGSISLTGNVTGGTVGGILVASAPQGNISVNGTGNDIFAIAGVTYKDEFRLSDSANGFSVFGAVTALGANPTAVISAANGPLTLEIDSKFVFSGGGGRLELSSTSATNPATGKINIRSPINIGGAGIGLVATGNIEGTGNITANTLDVLAGTLGLSGDITATQRLDATSIGNMTLSGNVNSNRLTLASSGGSISLIGNVTTGIFAANAPAGNVFVGGPNNNILTVADVTYDSDFKLNSSGLGLIVSGTVDGGPVSSATIEVRNGGLALAPGSKFIFGGASGLLKLFSDTSFENLAGTNALIPENGARWLIYSPSPAVTTLGGLQPDGRELYSVNYPFVPPNSGDTFGSRAVHASSDPFAAIASGPNLNAATSVGGYNTLNVLDGVLPPPLPTLTGLGLLNPFEAVAASAHLAARNELEALINDGPQGVFFRARTDGSLDATINAASRANELGLPYQIRAAAANSRDGDLIVARPISADGSRITVIMDNGEVFNVPFGGRVVADGNGGVKVLGEESPGLAATILARGTGSVVIAGQTSDSDIGYKDSVRLDISAAINRNVDAQLAAKFLKRVPLPSGGMVTISTIQPGLRDQSGIGGRVSQAQIYAMADASGLSPDDVSAMVAAGGGNLLPGVIAAMVAAGGGNMTGDRIARMVAAGGGNMVAAGGGNLLSANAVAQILTAMVAAGGGNMVAAGGGNMVAAGGGNLAAQAQQLVAAGGMNLNAQRIAALVGNDGASLIGNDGGTLVGNDGASLIGNDGGSLVGNDGASLIGNDGGSLIGNDGGTLISRLTAGLVAAGGLNLIGNDGGTFAARSGSLIGLDSATLLGRGGNVLGRISAGDLVNSGAFGGGFRP